MAPPMLCRAEKYEVLLAQAGLAGKTNTAEPYPAPGLQNVVRTRLASRGDWQAMFHSPDRHG